MTYFIPGIVIDVSAMLVARIHFRVFCGVDWKTSLFFVFSCAANMVHVSTLAILSKNAKATKAGNEQQVY